MTPDPDAPRPLLTDAERARLRPTVNADAFDRFLAEIPEEVRPGVQRAAVLHFSRDVSMTDIRDFLNAAGNEDAAAAVDRAITGPTPAAPDVEVRRRSEPAGDAYEATPPADRLFSMEPPESPRLRALWDAIEPPSSSG